MCGQDFGDSHRDGNVAIMPAGMHHAYILAAPVCTRRRRERQALGLGDRQSIHVRAQRYHRPRTSAANERRDNSGDGNLLSDLIAKLAQVLWRVPVRRPSRPRQNK
jgi:hypothetical protein